MADNLAVTPGSGALVAADEVPHSGDTTKVQLIKLVTVAGSEGSKTATAVDFNPNGQSDMAGSTPVAIASDQSAIAVKGGAASGAAASGNPVPLAGLAVAAEALVDAGDAAALITDLARKLITLPYTNPENMVSGTTAAMTGTTSTSLVAAPGAGLRNYITSIVISNSHATVSTDVVIQDGSGGTTLMTIPAAAVYGGAVINLPVPLRQPTANTALFCANLTTGASVKASAVGYKAA